MNSFRFIVFSAILSVVGAVFAVPANTLITFSTKADTYADGSAVVDGEWYALVWSANESFSGLTSELTPIDANDRVLICAKLAKNGHCPLTVFDIDVKDAPENGNYFVYLLDTRVNNVASAANAEGKPAVLNGSAKTDVSVPATKGGSVAVVSQTEKGVDAAWADSAVVGEVPEAKIVGIKLINDAKVKITVSGMIPSIQYDIKAGSDIANIKTSKLSLPGNAAGGDVEFLFDKSDARFFKVDRHSVEAK